MYYIEHVAWAKSRKGLIQAPYCFGLKRFWSFKNAPSQDVFSILHPQHACSTVRHYYELPSRELTYPPKNGILKMIFRTSPGGICIHSLEGITTASIDGWSRRNQEHHRRWRFLRRLRCPGHRSKIFPCETARENKKAISISEIGWACFRAHHRFFIRI